jgi:tRNA(adenine34) deaminase
MTDEYYMARALDLAKQAESLGEVPVGAVLVLDDKIIAEGYNQTIALNDPTAHAEIVAIREAGKIFGNHRLIGSSLYVTLEPCSMCAGSLLHARIDALVFGAYDHKTGAVCSCDNLLDKAYANHRCKFRGGILKEDCGNILKVFFSKRRRRGNIDVREGR